MRKFGVLAVVVVGVLAVPGASVANHGTTNDCTYALTPSNTMVYTPLPTGGDAAVYVHSTPNQSGMSGSADTAAGACLNNEATQPEGGVAECGTGTSASGSGGSATNGDGTYCVVDGDNDNNVTGQDDSYFGVSNYETDGKRGPNSCPAPGSPPNSGTNSGQCHGPSGGPWADLVPGDGPDLVCGNTSGNTWDATIRDGCSIP